MEKISKPFKILLKRWTAKSPKLYRTITDISLGIGIAATLIPVISGYNPEWIAVVSSILISIGSKLTVDK